VANRFRRSSELSVLASRDYSKTLSAVVPRNKMAMCLDDGNSDLVVDERRHTQRESLAKGMGMVAISSFGAACSYGLLHSDDGRIGVAGDPVVAKGICRNDEAK
jgi:hypothetical protein